MAHLGKKKWQIYIKSLLMGIYRHWWGRMSCNMWLLVLMDMHEWEKGKRKAVWILSENQKKNNKKKHYEFLPEFFWDEELLFAILLMSSSLLLLSQCFSHCAPPPPSASLLRMSVDLGQLQRISNWKFYLIYRVEIVLISLFMSGDIIACSFSVQLSYCSMEPEFVLLSSGILPPNSCAVTVQYQKGGRYSLTWTESHFLLLHPSPLLT